MANQQSIKRAIERKHLLEVIQRLRYLGRQGTALQGHDGTTTLPSYCAFSVQTPKTFYITPNGTLSTNTRITMCKMKFCISWLF